MAENERINWSLAQGLIREIDARANRVSSLLKGPLPNRAVLFSLLAALQVWASKYRAPGLIEAQGGENDELHNLLRCVALSRLEEYRRGAKVGLWFYPNPHHENLTVVLTDNLDRLTTAVSITEVCGLRTAYDSSVTIEVELLRRLGIDETLAAFSDRAVEYLDGFSVNGSEQQELLLPFPDADSLIQLEPVRLHSGRSAEDNIKLLQSRWQRFSRLFG